VTYRGLHGRRRTAATAHGRRARFRVSRHGTGWGRVLELAGVMANSGWGFLWRETRLRWLTADSGGRRTSPACERWCYGSRHRKTREGVGFSPCCKVVGAKEAGGEAASRETEAAAGSRRRKGAQFGPMGRKKSSGTPGPRANGADVGRRRGGTEDLFTGGGERRMAGDGAAAGFAGGGACEDGELRGSNWCGKEGAGGSYLGFYKGRKGESNGQGQLAINGHGGGRLPQGNQGGA
jgi:hypothetical protein